VLNDTLQIINDKLKVSLFILRYYCFLLFFPTSALPASGLVEGIISARQKTDTP